MYIQKRDISYYSSDRYKYRLRTKDAIRGTCSADLGRRHRRGALASRALPSGTPQGTPWGLRHRTVCQRVRLRWRLRAHWGPTSLRRTTVNRPPARCLSLCFSLTPSSLLFLNLPASLSHGREPVATLV